MSASGHTSGGKDDSKNDKEKAKAKFDPKTPPPGAPGQSIAEEKDRGETAGRSGDHSNQNSPIRWPWWAIFLNLLFTAVVAGAAIVQATITGRQLTSMGQQKTEMSTQSTQMTTQSELMEEQLGRMIEQNLTMIDQTKAAWKQVDQTKDAIAQAKRANDLTVASGRATLKKMQSGLDLAEAANTLAKENADKTLAKTGEALFIAREANVTAKTAAKEAISAAQESNRIAGRTANEQLRAYISVVMNPRPLFFRPESGAPFEMRMRFVNSGQTPAKAVVVRADTYYWSLKQQGGLDPTTFEALNGKGMTVGPGGEFPLFLPHSRKSADKRDGIPCVIGRIDYVDAFGGKRFTNFYFFLGPPAANGNGYEPIYADSWNDSN